MNVDILRISVVDADEFGAPGSTAVYEIIRGNDDHTFEITTDRNTNEGILCVVKVSKNETCRATFLSSGVAFKTNNVEHRILRVCVCARAEFEYCSVFHHLAELSAFSWSHNFSC